MLSSYRIVIRIYHTVHCAVSVAGCCELKIQWTLFVLQLFSTMEFLYLFLWCKIHLPLVFVMSKWRPASVFAKFNHVELLRLWLWYYFIAIEWENDDNHCWLYYIFCSISSYHSICHRFIFIRKAYRYREYRNTSTSRISNPLRIHDKCTKRLWRELQKTCHLAHSRKET